MSWQLLKSFSAVSIGGISISYFLNPETQFRKVFNSYTSNYTPSVEWDPNWDHRANTSLSKSSSNQEGEKSDKTRSKSTRHIILIRHGQYNLKGSVDSERILTELGRQQAKLTGQRLADLKIPIDTVVISTMTRAQETGKLILDQLPIKESVEVRHDSLIEEGAPIPPEPKVGHWRPEASVRILSPLHASVQFLCFYSF